MSVIRYLEKIVLSLKLPIIYVLDDCYVIAKIAVQVLMYYVNTQLFVVHMLHVVLPAPV